MSKTLLTHADANEMQRVEEFAATLPQGSPVTVLLEHVVAAITRGSSVALFETDRELSPNEAAELLGMSRPHLLKLMDRGLIACTRVGTHRRLCLNDVLDFIDRREKAGAEVAQALGTSEQHRINRVRDEVAPLSDEDRAALGMPPA
jgi:excisionase family DNA binding protein